MNEASDSQSPSKVVLSFPKFDVESLNKMDGPIFCNYETPGIENDIISKNSGNFLRFSYNSAESKCI